MRELMRNRTLIALIGLVLLAVLIWFGGPYISIAGWVPLGSVIGRLIALLAVTLVWTSVQTVRLLRRNRADQALSEGIVPGSPGFEGGAPDRLAQSFNDAVVELERRGSEGKRFSLYDTPWYVIVGPPGSGKTTALRQSGLDFLIGHAQQGAGGTRNCDWWFTREAVLLDTAGRYLTQDSDKHSDNVEWQAFLKLLKTHRPRQPLNGILIAISAADLIRLDDREMDVHVASIRERVGELVDLLEIQLPVYVIVTKCDLISGFTEFFNDLSPLDRKQVWGYTGDWAEREPSRGVLDSLSHELDELVKRLNDRVVSRCYGESSLGRRRILVGFAQQFAALKPRILALLEGAFSGARQQERVALRGVYFTSGTQEGTPLDRIVSSAAQSLGLDVAARQVNHDEKSYFLPALLRDVIFTEAGLVGKNRRVEQRLLFGRLGLYGLSVVGLVLTILGWWISSANNATYIDEVASPTLAFSDGLSARMALNTYGAALERLADARNIYTAAAQEDEQDQPLMGLGLDQSPVLEQAAEAAYRREVYNVLLPLFAADLQQQLASSASDPQRLYELLKSYLMLVEPDRLEVDQLLIVVEYVIRERQRLTAEQLDAAVRHLAFAFEVPHSMPRNDRLIETARRSLAQTPLEDLLLARVYSEFAVSERNTIRLSDGIGLQAEEFFSRRSGAPMDEFLEYRYSRQGFDLFESSLANKSILSLLSENWVLGDDYSLDRFDVSVLKSRVRRGYEDDYIRYWDGLIRDLEVRNVERLNRSSLLQILLSMSQSPSPVQGVLNLVTENTDLSPPVASEVEERLSATVSDQAARLSNVLGTGSNEAVPGMKPGESIRRHFAALHQLSGAPEPLREGLRAVYTELLAGSSLSAALNALRTLAVGQPAPINQWLEQVYGGGRSLVSGERVAQAKSAWRTDVLPFCERAIAGRYPVVPNASYDVTLDDFARFYGPGGLLQSFFEAHLADAVETTDGVWRWKANYGVRFSNRALRFFERADRVRRLYFAAGTKPRIDMTISGDFLSANLARVNWKIDGADVFYRHGPVSPWKIEWPGSVPSGSLLTFEHVPSGSSIIEAPGAWGIFRAIEDAQIVPLSGSSFFATFFSPSGAARFRVEMSTVDHPLLDRSIREVGCLAAL